MIGYLSSVLLTSPSIIFNLLGQMAEKMQPVASLIVFLSLTGGGINSRQRRLEVFLGRSLIIVLLF